MDFIMQANNSLKLTSTPLDLHLQESVGEADSGYNSNLSSFDSSCLTVSGTKSLVHFSTPENYLSINSASGSNERSENDEHELASRNLHYKFTRPCLVGREYVDFLYYLGERNDYFLILKRILSHLDDKDLYNVVAVSKCWKNVVLSVRNERKRFRQYIRRNESTKENRVAHNACEDKTYQSPRPTLMEIQNTGRNLTFSNSSVSSTSPPISRNNYRFEAYQKEARKVKLGKRLFSCPKCKLPSHVDQNFPNSAECTNTSCKYRFCILCQCEEHLTKMCNFISTPVMRKQSCQVGTQNSKKNLKRLLM